MSIIINANTKNIIAPTNASNGESRSGGRKSFNAGDLNIGSDINSQIELRKKNAQKKAMKLIKDAWDKDKKSADNLEKKISQREANNQEIYELEERKKDIEGFYNDLKDYYGVEPDSDEQKDLELLLKYQNNKLGVLSEEFSDEEINRLKELENGKLTEYQKKALELNSASIEFSEKIDENKLKNAVLKEDIYDARMAELKNRNMQKADAAAEEILDAASKDIVGLLVQDTKDKIDEKAEEEKEKAEKLAEEKEEQQEKIDAAKEYKSEQEAVVEKAREEKKEQEELLEDAIKAESLNTNTSTSEISESKVDMAIRNIDKLIKDNKLVNDDIKGIEIDFNF